METKKLNLEWVTDTIGNDYKNWNKGDIVKIQCQTGTGKTYFIKKVLIPSMESYERMLIVANRINLKRQLKMDLIEYYHATIPTTFEELDKLTRIGNVTILSYQTIAEIKNSSNYDKAKIDFSVYDYIVCDECHFFLSDGGFNNKCDLAWDALITTRHRNAIKIFISATMQEITKIIDLSVDKIHETGFGRSKTCKLHEYQTGKDYSYLNTKYFTSVKDLAIIIKNDVSKDKWLVFVTRKSDAETIAKVLEGHKSVAIVTKDTDLAQNEDLQSIIKESKFGCDCLICTKAMDNGINIADPEVKNVVVMSWDNISFIQELGRVRVDITNPLPLNLYIPTMSWSGFNTLMNKQYKPKEDLIELYSKDIQTFNSRFDRNYNRLPIDIFIKDNKGWQESRVGLMRLIRDDSFAQRMCAKFNEKEDPDAKQFAYIKCQLSWLGQLDTFSDENLIEDVIDDEDGQTLASYLETIIGQIMLTTKDRKDLIEHIGLIDSHNSNMKHHIIKFIKNITTLNSYILNDLKINYYIKQFPTTQIINGQKKRYKSAWQVLKLSEV